MVPNEEFHIFTIHFEPPKREQSLYKGHLCLVPRYPLYAWRFYCTQFLVILMEVGLI